jgi:hypothetical protein
VTPVSASGTRFWLGTHKPHWLWTPAADFPLFVSYRRLLDKATWRPSTHPWALDSGGFSELARFGRWTITPREYCAGVARAQREIGSLAWAAPQDMMCEPAMIHGGQVGKLRVPGTGLSCRVHQHWTVLNYITLVNLWPEYSGGPCPFIPVLQGWTLGDLEYCRELYRAAGVMLEALPLVGLGSVCRRQNTIRIGLIASWLAQDGIRLHGFGVKTEGLGMYAGHLASCDSMAWSYDAYRLGEPMEGCHHQTCSNCLRYATDWRARLLDRQLHQLAS